MGNPTHRGIYAYAQEAPKATRGAIVDFQDGSIATPQKGQWTIFPNPVVTGEILEAQGADLVATFNGQMGMEWRGFITYNYGKLVHFGYMINQSGLIVELGTGSGVSIDATDQLLVTWKGRVNVKVGDKVELFISGDFQYAPLLWNSVQLLALEGNTFSIDI